MPMFACLLDRPEVGFEVHGGAGAVDVGVVGADSCGNTFLRGAHRVSLLRSTRLLAKQMILDRFGIRLRRVGGFRQLRIFE